MYWDSNDDFESFCHQHNILIHFADDLHLKIRGYCYYDGTYYNVILNNKLCSNQLRLTTIHEIIHVLENHFIRNTMDMEVCEKQVGYIIKGLEQRISYQ